MATIRLQYGRQLLFNCFYFEISSVTPSPISFKNIFSKKFKTLCQLVSIVVGAGGPEPEIWPILPEPEFLSPEPELEEEKPEIAHH